MNHEQLRLASEAFRRGEIIYARRLVAQILLADPSSEEAWLLMARIVDDREQVIDCLEHAAKINPTNLATNSALRAMRRDKSTPAGSSLFTTQPAPIHPGDRVSSETVPVIKEARLKPIWLSVPETSAETIQPPRRQVNIPLLIGSLIVSMIILVAVIGPKLAPQDPMEEHPIIRVGDQFVIPPFSAFQVPGFILGSDRFGRDMLTRILYAVRPTLIMVSIVAMVRLFLGTLIGLGAGWSSGRLGQFLDELISAALSIPILLVALGMITVLGAETGLVAFIIGLSFNGWGETARLVHEQTQLIKRQLFIESARSLGATTFQLLTQHVLRQVMPMVWMLFAFEISSTMMVTAGLGFLGYYIGGDVWIDVGDFLARRTSGAPELGQMLATSWSNLLQSWPLVVTGLVIFITVLGFNLLGEGLRTRLNPEFINRNNPISLFRRRFTLWFEESIGYPASCWMKTNRLRPVLVVLVIAVIAAGVAILHTNISTGLNLSRAALLVPGGQIWAAQKVDPYGTYYLNSIGPENPERQWVINNPAGFSGSPAISADGTIYVAALDGTLIALNPDGTTRWQADLPEIPMGSLAVGAQGDIYVSDSSGGLSAFNPDGNLLWTYSVEATGKPTHGAIVGPNGTIYYLIESQIGDTLNALQPDGQLLWTVRPGTRAAGTGLRLSPDGEHIFIKNAVVDARDGSLVDLALPTQDSIAQVNQAHLLVGADGKTYLLAGHVVMEWNLTSQGFNLVQRINWNFRGEGYSQDSDLPLEAGASPSGDIWLFYSGIYGGTSVYWLDKAGKILSSFSFPLSKDSQVVAIDERGTTYICGVAYSAVQGPATMCQAYHRNASAPVWSNVVDETPDGIVGVAMAPGRLYVITPDGNLTALGDPSTLQPVSTP